MSQKSDLLAENQKLEMEIDQLEIALNECKDAKTNFNDHQKLINNIKISDNHWAGKYRNKNDDFINEVKNQLGNIDDDLIEGINAIVKAIETRKSMLNSNLSDIGSLNRSINSINQKLN